MSDRRVLSRPIVGLGSHYRNIAELIEDKRRIDLLADTLQISRRHVRKDTCDQWTIIGHSAHLQTVNEDCYLLYVETYSTRKWGAIKRKAETFGWKVSQDGDDEGCIILDLPNAIQAKFLRSVLGLKKLALRPAETIHNGAVSATQ